MQQISLREAERNEVGPEVSHLLQNSQFVTVFTADRKGTYPKPE